MKKEQDFRFVGYQFVGSQFHLHVVYFHVILPNATKYIYNLVDKKESIEQSKSSSLKIKCRMEVDYRS